MLEKLVTEWRDANRALDEAMYDEGKEDIHAELARHDAAAQALRKYAEEEME